MLVLFRIAGMMICTPLALGKHTQIPKRDARRMMACVLAASIAPTLNASGGEFHRDPWTLAVA